MRALEDGGALLIFRGYARRRGYRDLAAKAGAGMLAVLSGASVVPVFVRGSGRAWPRVEAPASREGDGHLRQAAQVEAKRGPAASGSTRWPVAEMMEAIARLRDGARPRAHALVGGVGGSRQRK